MTNTKRVTTNGPWTVGPVASDGYTPIYSDHLEYGFASLCKADLESLRDALIEHLAPEGPTHLAIFNLRTFNGAILTWDNLHVKIAGSTPTPDEVNEMTRAGAEHFGASSAVLVNLIPLAGA